MKKIHQSGENYLETILILSNRKSNIRAVDIVTELGYSKSSVSRAVNILKEEGYIEIDASGTIAFTEKGKKHSQHIYKRHKLLTEFLIDIGVSHETAEADACKIEHVISDETMNAIKNFRK